MSRDESTSLHANESLGVLRHVDDICTRFERTLGHSDAPSIEELLASADPGLRERLLRELLALEMDYRSQTGESLTLEYYRERFPHDGPLVKYLYYEHFVPAHIAEYSIQRLLGRGGFGVVFQGWDTRLMRSVALKVFRRDPLKPRSRRGGLLAEARSAAQLRHAGVVTVYAIQSDADGDEFLVLEYVDGQSLEEYLRSEQISPRDAARVMLEVVQALQHAHQQGLIHRDLKPANILLDRELRPRVTDFGLAVSFAALPHTQELAGTLAYMAPEQAAGETHRLDARTDLWAVGVILYRILAGALPFSGRTSQELLSAICHSEAAPVRDITPQVPPELARIVQQCMAKRISERYASAANLADDLAAFLSGRNEPDSTQGDADDLLARVVPKGLRCFDGNDRDFFLDLVPGPRDRYGTPSAVLFWQRHLQEVDAHETFRVGLLYGPSGCGKSSLIRAGILPRLPRTVKAIVVEGARDETELVLIRELRRRFPEMAADLALPEMLHELREGPWLAEGEKLVLIFDQFEQWLHGWRRDGVTQLIEMLRQCDGARVQSLILVRDDFWMPATRFFQELDVPLVEGFNTCAVDLFDRGHAIKVLAAFGVAYARLDAKSWQQPGLQRRFLERAVDELTEDGWIVPVRLCIFAEMIKSKPWSPATLQNVGGALAAR
jgi:eukaryotic-like serine/threonine-protein kinase